MKLNRHKTSRTVQLIRPRVATRDGNGARVFQREII